MSITREEVEHVARLSRLALTEEELARITVELGAILEYVKKIDELDTSNVPPMAHALAEANFFREDVAEKSLTRQDALSNAPEQSEGCFKVPRIIE